MFTDHGIFERVDRDGVAYFGGPAGDFYDLQASGEAFDSDWYAVADTSGRIFHFSRDVGRLAPEGRLIGVTGADDLFAEMTAHQAHPHRWHEWSGSEIVRASAPLEAWKEDAYAQAKQMHAAFLSQITLGATPEERDTWPAKADAARAHLAGAASAAQDAILDGEIQDGARTKNDLAAVVLSNDKRYRPFAGRARGVLSAHNTAISDAPGADIEAELEAARAECAAAYEALLAEFATYETPEVDVSDTLEARVAALEVATRGGGAPVTVGMIDALVARLDALEAAPVIEVSPFRFKSEFLEANRQDGEALETVDSNLRAEYEALEMARPLSEADEARRVELFENFYDYRG